MKTEPLKETTTRRVADISYAQHLADLRGGKHQTYGFTNRGGGGAASLCAVLKGIANLSGLFIIGDKNADITDEASGNRLRNAQLYPVARREQRSRAHLREECQSFRL